MLYIPYPYTLFDSLLYPINTVYSALLYSILLYSILYSTLLYSTLL